MAERVVLHVGAMKSGTTYLQDTLRVNRTRLADQGVLLPAGERAGAHQAAALNALGRETDGAGRDLRDTWDRLVRESREWPGTVVISSEMLAPAGPRQIDRIAEDLGPVEVVLTLRDLNRSIVAMWQETVQNGRAWTWDEYLRGVELGRPGTWDGPREELPAAARTFWRQQGAARLGRRWSRAGRVHVVTVPHPGAAPTLLLERFAEVAAFDPGGFEAARRGNASLGAASTEVLRRMNALLDERGMRFPLGQRLRKRVLAKSIMPRLGVEDPRLGLPVHDWVREHAEGMTTILRGQDPVLHGDWSDLEPVPVKGVDASAVDVDLVAAAAVTAYRRFRRKVGEVGGPDELAGLEDPEEAATAAVRGLADLVERSYRQATPA